MEKSYEDKNKGCGHGHLGVMVLAGLFIQSNMKHSAVEKRTLLLQAMADWSISLLIFAKPYRVPDNSDWVVDKLNLVSIFREMR